MTAPWSTSARGPQATVLGEEPPTARSAAGKAVPAGEPEAHVAREARLVGLHGLQLPTLADIERRRFRLWLLALGLFFVVTTAMVGLSMLDVEEEVDLLLPDRTINLALIVVVFGFCVYAAEKEVQLRRLTSHLLEERFVVTALSNRLREMEVMLDAGRAVNAVLETSNVLSRILDNAVRLLGASSGSVMLLDDEVLRTVCALGNDAALGGVVPVGQGVAGSVAATREPVLIRGRVTEGRLAATQSAICVPLVHREVLLGVLNLNAPVSLQFDEYNLRAVSLFGEHAATAIANARLYEAEQSHAQALRHRADHDDLTGLANRGMFQRRLADLLGGARPGALLLVDLDEFKWVNDRLGHDAGDALLRHVAERLRLAVRPDDLCARVGGDEFAVVLDGVDELHAGHAATRVLESLRMPFDAGGQLLAIEASIGLASTADAGDAQELYRKADLALYSAKAAGKGRIERFSEGLEARHREQALLEAELREGVTAGQFMVHYQPIVDIATGALRGAEALVRWQHPRLGLLFPDAFIGCAEQSGAIDELGEWVLLTATREAASWAQELELSVNVSPVQLRSGHLSARVEHILAATGLEPSRLVLEVTEHAALADALEGRNQLDGLRALGIRVAIDDFGTGYSSLSQLRELHVDCVKIDRAFVQGADRSEADAAILETITSLITRLGLDRVAEGIETQEQAQRMQDLGCVWGQGWLYSKAVSAEAFRSLQQPVSADA